MRKFEEQKFNIPALKGISAKNIEEHLKLYSGYVKNSNLILDSIRSEDTLRALAASNGAGQITISELQRRFSFEFNGMRNHEYYFESLEGGSTPLNTSGQLTKAIGQEWGSFDAW